MRQFLSIVLLSMLLNALGVESSPVANAANAPAGDATVIFSPAQPLLLTPIQMSSYAREGGAHKDSRLRITFVFEGTFAEEYALANGIDVTSPVIVQAETTLNQNLFGHSMFPMRMHSRVLPIAKIEILNDSKAAAEEYVDIDMSKLEGNLDIFWYGGAAIIAGAIYGCTQLLGG